MGRLKIILLYLPILWIGGCRHGNPAAPSPAPDHLRVQVTTTYTNVGSDRYHIDYEYVFWVEVWGNVADTLSDPLAPGDALDIRQIEVRDYSCNPQRPNVYSYRHPWPGPAIEERDNSPLATFRIDDSPCGINVELWVDVGKPGTSHYVQLRLDRAELLYPDQTRSQGIGVVQIVGNRLVGDLPKRPEL
jgi:hypothetical protein